MGQVRSEATEPDWMAGFEETLGRRVRPEYERGERPVRIVDLFAGCGGTTLGVADAAWEVGRGIEVLLAVDFDPAACDAYSANFPRANVVPADVEEIFGPAEPQALDGERSNRVRVVPGRLLSEFRGRGVDFLIGGPPCQGHSDLNNHSRRSDPRNQLYLAMVRAARRLRPRAVLIENVPAVRRAQEGVVDEAKRELAEELGYRVWDEVVDVSQLGTAQRRKRHVLLAVRGEPDPQLVFERIPKSPSSARTVAWAIDDLLGMEGSTPFDTASTPSDENRRRMDWLFRGNGNRYELPDRLRPPCHRNGGHSYLSVYGRLRWDEPAQTITTGFNSMGQGRFVHPLRPRTLTPHEAARLQGFPDFFRFDSSQRRSVWAKLIGNAVPPALSRFFAREVLVHWERRTRRNRRG